MGLCGSTPAAPDYAAEAVNGVNAAADALPLQKLIDSAALNGTKVTVNGKTYDFSGLGEADYQKAYADAMANAQLQNMRELGPEYIAQRQKELDIADPQGQAARKTLWDKIQTDLGNTGTGAEDSRTLQDSILADLEKGGQLTDDESKQVQQQTLGQQVARGNFLGGAAQNQQASDQIAASDALKSSRQQRAIAYLTSGSSPEDIQYRKTQQSLSDLSSFLSGQTPTAQFSNLSGAQTGAVPFYQTGAGPQLSPTAGSDAANFASAMYGITSNNALQTPNRWLTGLSTGIKTAGTVNSLGGWNFGSSPQMAGKYGGGSSWG